MKANFLSLKKVQASVMDDLCNIYRITTVSGTYGNVTSQRTLYASGVACGIRMTNGTIVERGQVRFVDYDAMLRIVDTIPILTTDEIEPIKKGEFQISGTFKPYSAPTVNSSVQHVQLKRQES
jgi:hypothetical protein